MFDDEDDFPDYFLDEEEEEDRRPAPSESAARRTDEAGTGRIIRFSDGGGRCEAGYGAIDDAEDDEAGEREDNNAPLQGCLSGWFVGVIALGLIIICAVGYFRYLSPVVDDATAIVHVANIERRGVFFKTFEAEIVDPERLADTTGVYTHPRSVSVVDAAVAAKLREARQKAVPVEIRYEVYSATLPWRGESKMVVVSATPQPKL